MEREGGEGGREKEGERVGGREGEEKRERVRGNNEIEYTIIY